MSYCRISEEPLDVTEVLKAVEGPGLGGVTTFIGNVRNHNQGREVLRIEYETYTSMSLKALRKIAGDIEADIPGTRVAVTHRIGALEVGDAAVMIAVAAPHRAEAFQGCRTCIERLKQEVPIWKKEFSPQGHTWVSNTP